MLSMMIKRDASLSPWPRLQRGDIVRIVSPASFPDETDVAALQAELESWGLMVQRGTHVFDRWGYMAGRDLDRLDDLNAAFRDSRVRAIFASLGGAGAYRIAEEIDFEAVRRDPKPLIGFSDISYLQMALWRECRLVTIHGAAVGKEATASVRQLLMDDTPVTVTRDPQAYSAKIQVEGRATGLLIGGNLSSITHMVGAGLPSLDGTILLLEDKRDMGLGRIDRQITQLKRAGALDNLAGLALGLFSGFDNYEDRGWTLVDVLKDHLEPLGIPVLGGLNIGHNGIGADGRPDQTCVKLGALATIDTAAGKLTSG
jgi:muramoyltetrapeptide carboxypeptidase